MKSLVEGLDVAWKALLSANKSLEEHGGSKDGSVLGPWRERYQRACE